MKHLPTQPCKGTRDFLPKEMSIRRQIFESLYNTVELFGFQRYDGPVLESASIYEAKSGEEIANQQMYRLTDKSGRELALRPEMTPSVARMVAGHQSEINFPARWYSHVNCHRYERPQKGRVREHWQLNVDIFGSEDEGAEIEIFDLIGSLMSAIGADESMYVIRVNDRVLIDAALTNYINLSENKLSDVTRIIDRWEKTDDEQRDEILTQIGLTDEQISRLKILVNLDLDDYLEAAGPEATKQSRISSIIRNSLSSSPLHFDPIIVRGFDYYTSTVFEVFDVSPENRRSLFGGGRYDNLAGLFTDRKIPGIGFGMGDVTTWHFLDQRGLLPEPDLGPDVFVFATDEAYRATLWEIVRLLRKADIRSAPALGFPSIQSGMKFANKTNAAFVVIISDSEYQSGVFSVKNMATREQVTLTLDEVLTFLKGSLVV